MSAETEEFARPYGVGEPSLRAAVARLGVVGHASLAPLLGGMSNVLYLARGAAGVPLVVRLLNPSLDAIIDRGREVRILQRLGAAGVSPRPQRTSTLAWPRAHSTCRRGAGGGGTRVARHAHRAPSAP